jgi:hypothetical protein
VLPNITREAPDVAGFGSSTSGMQPIAIATIFRIRDKEIRNVEMTLQKQENECNCDTVDLHTMRNGFEPEKSRTTSDGCHQPTKSIYRKTARS